ncbi:MAG: response regulator, partial [Bdellovibrionota bacterium]
MIRYIIRMPANLNPRLKVVVIDDKPENLLAFGAALKSLDCDLQKFSSGKEALVYLKSNEVALVLLDVQMPEMDGFEVAQRIRAEHGNAAPPIIFITALSPSPDFINKAYDCGAADFITKPVDSRILTAKVKVFLDLFVTRTKLAETILHAGEQKFRSLSESVPAIVFITDTRANTMYLNKYWYEYTGNTPGDLSLDAWIKAIHPDDLQKVNETWSAAEKSKTKWVCEYRLRRHDGVYHWHLGTSIPEKEIGNDFYWVGTVTDINDQKKIQTEVAESVKVLDQMFSESHSFMAILSYPELRFLKSNAKHKLLLRKNNFIGKTLLEVEPELESQGIVELLNEVASTGNPFVGTEVPIYYAATNSEPEKTSYLDFTYRPLEGADGKVYAILAQGYDVTEILAASTLDMAWHSVEKESDFKPTLVFEKEALEKYGL